MKNVKHGHWGTPTYRVWKSIKHRCENPKATAFKWYGARGVRVHPEWSKSFAAFLRDVGVKPDGDVEIDRIDGARGYEPGNTRWVTPAVNSQNRSTTKLTTEKVLEAKRLRASGMMWKDIARLMGVYLLTIQNAVRGKTWKQVGEPSPRCKNADSKGAP